MTGEYAIRAITYLASIPMGKMVHISDISSSQKIPETLLRKIIGQLVKLGFIFSTRGAGGGVRLARPPAEITLLEIVESMEGKIFLNQCLIGPEFCERSAYCAVHFVWQEVQDKMVEILGGRSLADVNEENIKRLKNLTNPAQLTA